MSNFFERLSEFIQRIHIIIFVLLIIWQFFGFNSEIDTPLSIAKEITGWDFPFSILVIVLPLGLSMWIWAYLLDSFIEDHKKRLKDF